MSKLILEFNEKMNAVLQELANRNGTNKIDIVKRALALYKYLDEVTRKDGEWIDD